jgi:ADP-ribose diphosphatase
VNEPVPKPISRKTVYDGRKVRLEVHEVETPDGRRATREVICHVGSVAVLAFRRAADGCREVLLERNYRYSVGRYMTEIPAGTLDVPDEPPVACARRELQEETGCRAAELRELMAVHPSPGLLGERLIVFVAEEVEPGEAALEPGELITVHWTPWAEALRQVASGEITDAKTVAAMLYYELFASQDDPMMDRRRGV